MPEAKFDRVSCRAKPIITPAIPKPASSGPSSIPSWDRATKSPMVKTALPDSEVKKSCNNLLKFNLELLTVFFTICLANLPARPAIIKIKQNTNNLNTTVGP